MQPRGDLENSWIMFHNVKQIIGWTTMTYHVYDLILQSHDHCSLRHAIRKHRSTTDYVDKVQPNNAQTWVC